MGLAVFGQCADMAQLFASDDKQLAADTDLLYTGVDVIGKQKDDNCCRLLSVLLFTKISRAAISQSGYSGGLFCGVGSRYCC